MGGVRESGAPAPERLPMAGMAGRGCLRRLNRTVPVRMLPRMGGAVILPKTLHKCGC